jgi:hypothetical protein
MDHSQNRRGLPARKFGGKRRITRSGIMFNLLNYQSDSVADLLNDLVPPERKHGAPIGQVVVNIEYWPDDLSKIAVWNPARQTYVELPCTNQKYANGLSEHNQRALIDSSKRHALEFGAEQDRAVSARLSAFPAAILDCAVLDCCCVNDDRPKVVGHPYIMTLTDTHTGYPVAFEIALVPPNAEAITRFVLRAHTQRTQLKARFPDIDGQIPFDVPRTIIFDDVHWYSNAKMIEMIKKCAIEGMTAYCLSSLSPQYNAISGRFLWSLNQFLAVTRNDDERIRRLFGENLGHVSSHVATFHVSALERLIYQFIVCVYGPKLRTGVLRRSDCPEVNDA